MVMRYFGGGIGHLKNTPLQQVPGLDLIDPSSEEMVVEEEDGSGTMTNDYIVMNSGSSGELVRLDVGEDDEVDEDEDDEEDEEDSDGNEGGDQTDEEEDGEDDYGEDDYGYASP
jgi:cobalamin biosynthesis protein CobT